MSRRLTNNNNSSIAFANKKNQGLYGAPDDIFYGSLSLEIANDEKGKLEHCNSNQFWMMQIKFSASM